MLLSSPGSQVHPWLLGSLDENNVQGFGGIPVNTNSFMVDFRVDVGAVSAGYGFPGGGATWVAAGALPTGWLGAAKARIALALGLGAGLRGESLASLLAG